MFQYQSRIENTRCLSEEKMHSMCMFRAEVRITDSFEDQTRLTGRRPD